MLCLSIYFIRIFLIAPKTNEHETIAGLLICKKILTNIRVQRNPSYEQCVGDQESYPETPLQNQRHTQWES